MLYLKYLGPEGIKILCQRTLFRVTTNLLEINSTVAGYTGYDGVLTYNPL